MDVSSFEESVNQNSPPQGLSPALEALWHERRGDWDRAHRIAQDIAGPEGAWVHAYLHRREGDQSNAEYWYDRAAKPASRDSLEDEWRQIAEALLNA